VDGIGWQIMKREFDLNSEKDKYFAINAIKAITDYTIRQKMTIETEKRSIGDNKKQWPILTAFANQVQWPVNGQMVYMTPENWKDVLTAAFRKEVPKMAMAFDYSGVVMLGQRTREFKKEEWPEWMAFLKWAAAEKGVKIPVSKKESEAWGVE